MKFKKKLIRKSYENMKVNTFNNVPHYSRTTKDDGCRLCV